MALPLVTSRTRRQIFPLLLLMFPLPLGLRAADVAAISCSTSSISSSSLRCLWLWRLLLLLFASVRSAIWIVDRGSRLPLRAKTHTHTRTVALTGCTCSRASTHTNTETQTQTLTQTHYCTRVLRSFVLCFSSFSFGVAFVFVFYALVTSAHIDCHAATALCKFELCFGSPHRQCLKRRV